MNNVYCDKPGHGAYPLRACEKDGKIFVDMDSCTECGPQKMEEEEVYQSFWIDCVSFPISWTA